MEKVLVTGASGFVGTHLCRQLSDTGYNVKATQRSDGSNRRGSGREDPSAYNWISSGEIGPDTDWKDALEGVSVVFHLAGRAHILRETMQDPLAEYRRVNVYGTEKLLEEASKQGVRRFIFLSSIGVNGNWTKDRPFSGEDKPNPHNDYALSKLEAERIITDYSARTGLEGVIIRPPLIYGPGVKANFLKLLQAIDRGFPLPLGKVANKRSLIGVQNLVDFLILCINHSAVAGQTFLVSDGEDISTPDLIALIAALMNKKPHLWSPPLWLVSSGLKLLGKQGIYDSLCLSLQIDARNVRECMEWEPPVTLEEGLRETVEWYRRKM